MVRKAELLGRRVLVAGFGDAINRYLLGNIPIYDGEENKSNLHYGISFVHCGDLKRATLEEKYDLVILNIEDTLNLRDLWGSLLANFYNPQFLNFNIPVLLACSNVEKQRELFRSFRSQNREVIKDVICMNNEKSLEELVEKTFEAITTFDLSNPSSLGIIGIGDIGSNLSYRVISRNGQPSLCGDLDMKNLYCFSRRYTLPTYEEELICLGDDEGTTKVHTAKNINQVVDNSDTIVVTIGSGPEEQKMVLTGRASRDKFFDMYVKDIIEIGNAVGQKRRNILIATNPVHALSSLFESFAPNCNVYGLTSLTYKRFGKFFKRYIAPVCHLDRDKIKFDFDLLGFHGERALHPYNLTVNNIPLEFIRSGLSRRVLSGIIGQTAEWGIKSAIELNKGRADYLKASAELFRNLEFVKKGGKFFSSVSVPVERFFGDADFSEDMPRRAHVGCMVKSLFGKLFVEKLPLIPPHLKSLFSLSLRKQAELLLTSPVLKEEKYQERIRRYLFS